MLIAISILLLIIFVPFIIYLGDTKLLDSVTSSNRGTQSERELVLKLLKNGYLAENIFHDLYVKKSNGGFSQIDLVVATKVGIIVFEVKSYKGWLFGNGRYTQWTQVLAYGKKKFRFLNPIIQNKNHIENLKRYHLPLVQVPIYSVIVFYGECELKEISFVPRDTYVVKAQRIIELMDLLHRKNEMVHYPNLNEILIAFRQAVKNGENKEIVWQHIKDIEDMLGSDRVFK